MLLNLLEENKYTCFPRYTKIYKNEHRDAVGMLGF